MVKEPVELGWGAEGSIMPHPNFFARISQQHFSLGTFFNHF